MTPAGCTTWRKKSWHPGLLRRWISRIDPRSPVPDGNTIKQSSPILSSIRYFVTYRYHIWRYASQEHFPCFRKYDVVCDYKYLAQVAQSTYMFGVLIGCVLSGHLADRCYYLPYYLLFHWDISRSAYVRPIFVQYTLLLELILHPLWCP